MKQLAELFASREDWLIRRVLDYAKRHGYTRYTSTLEEAWRSSIAGLSADLCHALNHYCPLPELDQYGDYTTDPIAAFGVGAAQRHRTRGVTLDMFFGLMKFYRQGYLDLLAREKLPASLRSAGSTFVERFFDRVERGFVGEWDRTTREQQLAELQDANRLITNEKKRFLTIFESLPNPVILLDSHGQVELMNHAAAKLLDELAVPGGHYYGTGRPDGAALVAQLTGSQLPVAAAVSERELVTRTGRQQYQVMAREMLDVSDKFAGTVLILTDITPLKEIERRLKELYADQESRIKARTAELLLANDKLQQEVRIRSQAEAEVQRLNTELAHRVAQRTEELQAISEENDRKLAELTLLHRVGSVLLTTVNLNKLVHLILTGLTSGPVPVFERAMLFLINERSGVLQGMLGVTREDATGTTAHAGEFLDEGWRVTDEEMARQRDSVFSASVRDCRLELSRSRNVASQAVLEKRIICVSDTAASKRVAREIVQRFGIKSFAVAPLLGKEQVFGVVVVDNPVSRRPIDADALRFLELFTNQAGVAIENSMLYMRLEDANRHLRDAQEQLIHGERLATIGEMAASIAHELKGPLVAIGGFARRLGKRVAPASAEESAATMIVTEVQRLERMLGDILTYTKKTTICYDNCVIGDIFDDSLAIVMPVLEACGITVIRHQPRRPVALYGDCQQLKQVFINLFCNAQEAMKDGGELRITVAAATLAGKPAISVKVADSGEGIPLSVLNSIFHSFYTTKTIGTGLGLPIANRIVTNHGGKIKVASQPGKGAEFTVLLPRQG